jgi:MFS superfamily sulfate permease-like transporter
MAEQLPLKFSLSELSGAFGDFGTILPLTLSVALVCNLNLGAIFLFMGIWYIISGLYYRLPVPIEPMKAIAAIAIAEVLTQGTIAAAGIIMGIVFLLLGFGRGMKILERYIPMSVIRGIQLGLAFILLRTTFGFAYGDLIIFGLGTLVVIIFFLAGRYTRIPDVSAIVIVAVAIGVGVILHGMPALHWIEPLSLILPDSASYLSSLTTLVLPQALLTLTNAILATVLLLQDLFQEQVPAKNLSRMIGAMNLISVPLGGFPMCHGAGGLAGQYRFGGRTGGSDVYAGMVLLIFAFFFAGGGLLSIIPTGFYGALLLFAALELARHGIKTDQYVITILIAVLALLVGMTAGFLAGMLLFYVIWHVNQRKGSERKGVITS